MTARIALVRSRRAGLMCVAMALTFCSATTPAIGQGDPTLRGARPFDASGVALRAPKSSSSPQSSPTLAARSLGAKTTSGIVWSVAGAAGGLLIGVLVGESIRQGTLSDDSVTNEYNSKMATTVGLGLLVPFGAALGAAHGVNNIGQTHGNRNAVKGVALATAYAAATIIIVSKIKRDDPDLVRFKPNRDILVPLPIATVLSSIAAALITDAATTR
jgi:hypothetical protein